MAVFDSAPANVLHGAVIEQGLASSPVSPSTQVRVAWAYDSDGSASAATTANEAGTTVLRRRDLMILLDEIGG